MVGKILEVLVKPGEAVAPEQDLLVIESMKMEIPISAPQGGRVVEIRVTVGQGVRPGEILLVLE
jgi:acetyl-CoA carboxylase biotin carboxyl carrier protein